jgi:hypothetical protein
MSNHEGGNGNGNGNTIGPKTKISLGWVMGLIGFLLINEFALVVWGKGLSDDVASIKTDQSTFIQTQTQLNKEYVQQIQDLKDKLADEKRSEEVFHAKVKSRLNIGD